MPESNTTEEIVLPKQEVTRNNITLIFETVKKKRADLAVPGLAVFLGVPYVEQETEESADAYVSRLRQHLSTLVEYIGVEDAYDRVLSSLNKDAAQWYADATNKGTEPVNLDKWKGFAVELESGEEKISTMEGREKKLTDILLNDPTIFTDQVRCKKIIEEAKSLREAIAKRKANYAMRRAGQKPSETEAPVAQAA